MLSSFRKPLLAIFAAFYLSSLMTAPSWAGMIGSLSASQPATNHEVRESEVAKVQRALETEIVKSKFEAYGLNPAEISARLQVMTDEQVHLLAQATDDVLAGGDGLGLLIGVLLVVLLVIVILKVTGHSVIVK